MNTYQNSSQHTAVAAAAAHLAGAQRAPFANAGLAGVLLRMLDELDYGLLLVTPSGQLRYGNQLALHSLAGSSALRLQNGVVSALRGGEQTQLHAALAGAARGLRRLLNLDHGGVTTSLAVLPIAAGDDASDADADTPPEPLVMLVLGKQAANRTLTLDFFARSHRLTGAESKVLQGLCSGMRPKAIAEQLCVEISTVRTQIGSMRTKTQTTSIVDLMNKVAQLPPITPAVKTMVCH